MPGSVRKRKTRRNLESTAKNAEGMHRPIRLGAGLARGGDETLAICFKQEDGLPAVAARRHMTNRPFLFHA